MGSPVRWFLFILLATGTGPSPDQPNRQASRPVVNSIGMKLVRIPAGKFTMGSPKGELEREDREEDQHEVQITRAFYLGMYEVTQKQYREVMGENPSQF